MFFPNNILNTRPVFAFSLDDEEDMDGFSEDDKFFSEEDIDDEKDPWFPGDDENGDDDFGFGSDEDYNY